MFATTENTELAVGGGILLAITNIITLVFYLKGKIRESRIQDKKDEIQMEEEEIRQEQGRIAEWKKLWEEKESSRKEEIRKIKEELKENKAHFAKIEELERTCSEERIRQDGLIIKQQEQITRLKAQVTRLREMLQKLLNQGSLSNHIPGVMLDLETGDDE